MGFVVRMMAMRVVMSVIMVGTARVRPVVCVDVVVVNVVRDHGGA